MSDKLYRYIACCVCGARWIESKDELLSLACSNCHSTAVVLQDNLKENTVNILKAHATFTGSKPSQNYWLNPRGYTD